MSEQAILLKIKREFTQDEAVKELLKRLSQAETEIGYLKSELAEAEFRLREKEEGQVKTKKTWLKDELIKDMNDQMKILEEKANKASKDQKYWQDRYFSLLAQNQVNGTNNSQAAVQGQETVRG